MKENQIYRAGYEYASVTYEQENHVDGWGWLL